MGLETIPFDFRAIEQMKKHVLECAVGLGDLNAKSRIFVSATEPENPQVNDIWIDIS